jgi:hypothetical protein
MTEKTSTPALNIARAYMGMAQQVQTQLVFEPMRKYNAMMINFAITPQAKQAAFLMNEGTERTIALSKAISKSL